MGPSWNLGFTCWILSGFSLRMRSSRSRLTLVDQRPRTPKIGLSLNWLRKEDFPVISIFHASVRDASPGQKSLVQTDRLLPTGRPASSAECPWATRPPTIPALRVQRWLTCFETFVRRFGPEAQCPLLQKMGYEQSKLPMPVIDRHRPGNPFSSINSCIFMTGLLAFVLSKAHRHHGWMILSYDRLLRLRRIFFQSTPNPAGKYYSVERVQ